MQYTEEEIDKIKDILYVIAKIEIKNINNKI